MELKLLVYESIHQNLLATFARFTFDVALQRELIF